MRPRPNPVLEAASTWSTTWETSRLSCRHLTMNARTDWRVPQPIPRRRPPPAWSRETLSARPCPLPGSRTTSTICSSCSRTPWSPSGASPAPRRSARRLTPSTWPSPERARSPATSWRSIATARFKSPSPPRPTGWSTRSDPSCRASSPATCACISSSPGTRLPSRWTATASAKSSSISSRTPPKPSPGGKATSPWKPPRSN